MLIASALMCMALNVYHESRGEPVEGQYGVALVTMNRAKESGQVCDTVMAPAQFSWTVGSKRVGKRRYVIPKRLEPRDKKAWGKAIAVAGITLNGMVVDFTKGATHYDRSDINAGWERRMRVTARIGHHRFMVPNKSSVTKHGELA